MDVGRVLGVALLVLAMAHAGVARGERLTGAGAGADMTSLRIKVVGLKSDRGRVAYALFDSATSYERRGAPVKEGFAVIRDRQSEWVLDDLAPGEYALMLFHDRNGNRRLDTNAIRVPTEPYGFSNNVRGAFGPPAYEHAKFLVPSNGTVIEVKLR